MTDTSRAKLAALLVGASLMAALALSRPAWADESATEKTPSQSGASLDDQLLKQLDSDLEGRDLEGRELEGKAPVDQGHKHHPDSPSKKASAEAGEPSSPKAGKPSPRSAKASTDEDLLKQLDAEDEPGSGPGKPKPGDDLGENADPLTRIGSKMRQAVSLIDREKLSDKTTALQDEIVKDIDELIKQQKKQMRQQQQSNSQSQQQQQQSSRSNVKPQGKQAQQQRPSQGGGERQSKQAAKESEDQARKNEQKTVKLDPAAQDELLKRVWGILPEKDREQMRQAAGDQFLPEYESLIIRYFRRLAEDEDSRR